MSDATRAATGQGGLVLGVERSMAGQGWRHRLGAAGERAALAMAQAHGMPDLLARVLASRGVDALTCETYRHPTLRTLMPDPEVLTGLKEAVARLAVAVAAGERIGIIGDYDVDGAAASALLAGYLEAVDLACEIHIPDRVAEGYGPSLAAVDRLAGSGVSLLVTVDCGSASHEPLARAKASGLDVLVFDHHQIASPFPPADAIVNPNRPDDLSGLGTLCAAGVVFMVLAGLHRRLKTDGFWTGRDAPDLLAGLDLVALATVADVVPLVGLNRAFVVKGLEVMRLRTRPGLAALFDVAGIDGPPNAFHLGYLAGPRINAGGRIGDAGLGTRLLLTGDPLEAARIAADLDRLNIDRRTIEAEALEHALAQALVMLEMDRGSPVLVAAREGWHPGVMGLVAARLKERFGRPAFAIALSGLTGTGSGRSILGADLGAAVRASVEAGLLHRGGGHAMAAGLTIAADQITAFKAFMRVHFAEAVGALRDGEALLIDAPLSAAAATPDLVTMLAAAGPFGAGSPDPVVVLPNHRVVEVAEVGEDHMRLMLSGPDGSRLRAMAFRVRRTPLAAGLAETRGRLIHCAGTLTLNRYNGAAPRAELRLLDAAPAA